MEIISDKSIKQQLDIYPSLFNLDTNKLSFPRAKSLIDKLANDKEGNVKQAEELIDMLNFLSYLYYFVDEFEKALENCEEVLRDKDTCNLNALVNKGKCLLKIGEIAQAEKTLSQLKNLEMRPEFSEKKLISKAGLAYAFSRAGNDYHQQAVETYREVIQIRPTEYFWKYRLALTLRRQTHFRNSVSTDIYEPKSNSCEASDLFLEIATSKTHENGAIRALAWSEIGYINHLRTTDGRFKDCSGSKAFSFTSEQCVENAIRCCSDDSYVLQNCGRLLRYLNKYEESEKLLRKAIAISPTIFAYHHLSLILESKVLQNLNESDANSYSQNSLSGSDERLPSFPENSILIEGISHLESALELSHNSAVVIALEMGKFYRMLDEPRKALKYFKGITYIRSYKPTQVELATAYEQLGTCFIEISKTLKSPIEQDENQTNAKCAFMKAIEQQAGILRLAPEMSDEWHSFPTMKQLLCSHESGHALKELGRIHKLIGQYRESIDFYERFIRENSDQNDDEVCRELIHNYMEIEDYESALLLLSFLRKTNHFDAITKSTQMQICITGAEKAFQREEIHLAKERYQLAFSVAKTTITDEDKKQTNPIYIVHQCQEPRCKSHSQLQTMIHELTGLESLVNQEDSFLGERKFDVIISTMTKSIFILILLHRVDDIKCSEHIIDYALSQCKEKVIFVYEEESEIHQTLRGSQIIHYPEIKSTDNFEESNENRLAFLSELFKMF